MEIVLVFEYIIFITRIADVYQMVRNFFPTYHIVCQILPGPDVHGTVDLPGVPADNLRVQTCRLRPKMFCRMRWGL